RSRKRTGKGQHFPRILANGASAEGTRGRGKAGRYAGRLRICHRMKKRILVVEDEEKLRRVIELQLMSAGFDVDKAATAEDGVKIVDRADMVLTDLKLPNMDGLQFLNLIRRQNAQVPVVMMT